MKIIYVTNTQSIFLAVLAIFLIGVMFHIYLDSLNIKAYMSVQSQNNQIKGINSKHIDNINTLKSNPQDGILSNEQGNAWIMDSFDRGWPFLVGRLSMGAEFCLLLAYRKGTITEKSCAHHGPHRSAGIYPETAEMFRTYAEILTESLKQLTSTDAMGSFEQNEENTVLKAMPSVVFKNRALEPFYFNDPWSQKLKGKTVLIVHGFIPSIKCQLRRREKLFSNPLTLPEFEPKFVKMPFAHGFRRPHGSYLETLDAVKAKIDAVGHFDITIVSAGAYAMPLAVYCKNKHNATAFAMGGGTQLLFGLKGHRWDSHPVLSKIYNPHWMYPLEEDTPNNAVDIEIGGPYWGRRGQRLNKCPVQ